MAKQVTDADWQLRKYPWSEWTNGSVWEAEHGKDFHVGVTSFRSALYGHAERNGLKVTVSETGVGKVRFQFTQAAEQDS